jgi:hypothetical protein
MKPRDPCAMCSRFTTAGYDQQAAAGMGRCTGFDNDGQPEQFVRHDQAPCVLFLRRKAEPTNQRRNRA